MEITVFNGARDTAPINQTITWPELCQFLVEEIDRPVFRSDKLDHFAMIFGRCAGLRAKGNVAFLSGLAADFDIGPDDPRYVGFDAMCNRLEADGLAFVGYTTTANDAGHNRYRLVLPYAADVPASRCQAAWHACNAKFGGAIDASTKDESRLSFLPCGWTGNPYRDLHKGSVTLAAPFTAIRYQVEGAPILTAAEIAALAINIVPPVGNIMRVAMATPVQSRLPPDVLRSLAHDKREDDPAWALLGSLTHSPLVPRWTLDKLPSEEGNRDYRFMLAVASCAIRQRLPVTADIMITLAEQFARQFLHRQPPFDIGRQAENALAWAYQNSGEQSSGPRQPDAGN